jgi:RimJ/RimL family protein N-acetyltransferase
VPERPLYAYLAAHNHASRRVLEKCGFIMQGSVRTPDGLSPLDGEELLMKLDDEQVWGLGYLICAIGYSFLPGAMAQCQSFQ